VKEIERSAHQIRSEIAAGKFDLQSWRSRKQREPIATVGHWVAQFERDYFTRRRRTDKSRLTYRTEYAAMFRRLPGDAPLTIDLLRSAILATEPDSRSRIRACLCFGRLAEFAGLDADEFRKLRGDYRAESVDARSLPSKSEIVTVLEAIPSDVWRSFAQRLYVYGLRNHEGFKVEGFDGEALRVGAGKTGARAVLPCDRQLVDRWNLKAIALPECSGSHDALGHGVSTQFRRYGLPFRPYDLRHCYARELHEAGATSHFAAKMMGHGVAVHERIYTAWFGLDSYLRQYDRLSL
jgi:integrase